MIKIKVYCEENNFSFGDFKEVWLLDIQRGEKDEQATVSVKDLGIRK